ncbi:glycosyltransferase family 2 protein [Leuconostoc mesenteroides]|uniref:glycosyltransferase family 2 protein n=1 Tax=Leuconostoc mesenteroides TaxID=1245 RepID=UPI001CBBBC46|nr:glycosyltransferase family 2 protein [Leuconostoc mesenteroides]MBZ1503429.1 glycosyltransferase family 2 protein [Leuconostoc mesenteroides]
MKNIAILMSTYNGEKYVEEQIISIFHQNYDESQLNLTLYIRDDHSSDSTREIIAKLSKKYNIVLDFDGQNLGFAKSFYKLLDKAEADYYFFADQDDVWVPNKLSLFVDRFNKLENQGQKNIGVFSDAWIANELAESTGKRLLEARSPRIRDYKLSFLDQLFEFYAQGASMAVNKRIIEKLLELPFTEIPFKESHDHFIGLVVSHIGCMSYIHEATLLYRQTGSNVYGARNDANKSILQRLESISSRVKTVQFLLLTAELVSASIGSEVNKGISDELQKLNTKKNIYYATKFFIRYRRYVSYSNPIIVSLLYGIYFNPNTVLHQQILSLIHRRCPHENNLGTSTKL